MDFLTNKKTGEVFPTDSSGVSSSDFHNKESDVISTSIEQVHLKENDEKISEDEVWNYINSLDKPMSESSILSKWGSRGDPDRSEAADHIYRMIDSGRLEYYGDNVGTSKHMEHRRPVVTGDHEERMYYENIKDLEKRNEDIRQLALKHGKEYNIDPENIVMTSGSNYNSPNDATPPYLSYVFYVNAATAEQREKLIEKLSKMGLEVKDQGDTYINFKDKYIEPNNHAWHKLGFDQKKWQEMTGIGIWDKKGRNLNDPNFGNR